MYLPAPSGSHGSTAFSDPSTKRSIVQVVPVGQATGNLAVTTISTRPDPRDNRRQQLFTRVENFAGAPAQAVMTVTVDGSALEDRQLDLEANGSSEQVFDDLPAGARWASVSVSSKDAENALALLGIDRDGRRARG